MATSKLSSFFIDYHFQCGFIQLSPISQSPGIFAWRQIGIRLRHAGA